MAENQVAALFRFLSNGYSLSAMSSILSLAEKVTLVTSFLKIVVGRSIETAEHFLQATNWRIEDALNLYYVGAARQSDAFSSNFMPVEFAPLLSDHNYSILEDNILNVNAGQSDAHDMRHPLLLNTLVPPAAALCGTDPVTPASTLTTGCQKRCTHIEIAIPTLSSRHDHRCLVCALPITRPRQKKPTLERSLPPINRVPSSDDAVGTSCRTRSRSTKPMYSRQSKRLRTLQQNCPLQDSSLPQSRLVICTADVAGPSRRLRAQSADCTPTRKSRRLAAVQEGCSLQSPKNKRKAIGDHHILAAMTPLPPSEDCSKCGALKLAFDTPNLCCSNGQIHLAQNELPSELLDLYGGTGDNARHFRDYARMYNNTFSFSSLGGSAGASTHKGIYVFQLYGQLYHNVPKLTPENKSPGYLQLYFYDAQSEKAYRNCIFPEVEAAIVDILMEVTERNPYANFFRSLREFPISEHTKIALSHNPTLDQRVYNAPTSDEVAVIFVENPNSNTVHSPHILVNGKGDDTHRVMHYYGCYDPLQYPLLYPNGECGWHQGIRKMSAGGQQPYTNPTFPLSAALGQTATDLLTAEAKCARKPNSQVKDKAQVSCRQYYAYKIQMRTCNYLLKAGRLFQQYIVDMYVKIENTRLDYLRYNQTTLRADLYQGVLDSLGTGQNNATNIGHRIILPPSFIGGPRDVKRRYLNAMALVQRFGKPDLFITMTCNPNWPEIKDMLLPGEKSEDRPDVVARVFKAKLHMLKDEINKKRVFGTVVARVDVVEFQKRGLPHAHLLIILEQDDKIHSPETYDQYVCAEIPSMENPHLRSPVIRHMLHGPCGSEHPNCACMRLKGRTLKCKSKYPKAYAEFMTCDDNSYPVYRRRNTGEKIRIRGGVLDNRWVIPYNPYLLAMFDCHINVEICSTISAVKYLYKYLYKGIDRVSFDIVQFGMHANDEIWSYQSAIWISPPESAWRIFKFNLYDINPAVIPLQIHLPQMQSISFRANANLDHIVNDVFKSKTMLTEFFTANVRDQVQGKYFYSEFPQVYAWKSSGRVWHKRDKCPSVGRLTYVSPLEGERYYLRLLLLHVRGPASYESLLTLHGHTYSTFQEAAQKRGFIEEDGYTDSCMNEAVETQMPHTLRRLFATLLVFCEPQNPLTFWDRHFTALSEDFRRKYLADEIKVMQLTLLEVERHLEGMGKSLKDYKMHEILNLESNTTRTSRDITDALTAPIPPEYIHASKRLNVAQSLAYKRIMQCVKVGKSGAFFVDGPGGTGKTFLYCALYAKLRSMGKIVLPTSTSGIAASNMPTGRTAHSRFKIPIDEDGSLACNVPKQSSLASLIKETSLIIWDEASMAKKENIESLDLLLHDLCENTELFGGKIVVFGGDFRQVLPVLPGRTQQEAIDASLVSSYLWPSLIKFRLTENMRAKEDLQFAEFLLKLGNGELQTQEHANIELPTNMTSIIANKADDYDILVHTVYPEMISNPANTDIYSEMAILTPTNAGVDQINEALIHKFSGAAVTYHNHDSLIDDNCNTFPTEYLNSLCPAGMSPHLMILKENCPVILLRNIDPSSGLCNGTRLICRKFFPHVILCEISSGYYKGDLVFLPRITLRPPASTKFPFQLQRKQFPINLCFAMTVNKSQGQTLHRVALYLRQSCFSHGQLYVGVSRARTAANVRVFLHSKEQECESLLVRNVVSYEVLRRAGVIQYRTED